MLCSHCNKIIAGRCYIQSNPLGETEDSLCEECCHKLGVECNDRW